MPAPCNMAVDRAFDEGHGRLAVPEGQKFTDISFFGNYAQTNQISDPNEVIPKWDFRVKPWKRLTEIFETPKLFDKGGPNHYGVAQYGKTCWYYAALAAYSEWPERITKMFNGKTTYPENG